MMSRFTLPPAVRSGSERQLAEFLLALAGLLQRLPGDSNGGSSLEPYFRGLTQSLDAVLAGRDMLTIEVGEVQLLVEGMGTHPEFEPLRELALRLRRTGVSALEFQSGITRQELVDVLSALASHPGGASVARLSGPHLALRALPQPERTPAEAWRELAQVILEDPSSADPAADPMELATALELHPSDPAYDGAVLRQLAICARASSANGGLVRLVAALPAVTLRRLLSTRGDWEAQRTFLEAAPDVLPASLVVRLLVVGAQVRGRALSPATQRLFAKLARLAASSELQSRASARLAVAAESRRVLSSLMDDRVGEPGPDLLSAEPERVLKLSLESGVVEEGTLGAVDRMIGRRMVGQILTLLDTVPRDDPVARALRARLYHPRVVRVLLESSPPDLDMLDRLVPACGIEAAPALLEVLATAPERRVRLRLLDLASRYGEAIGPLVSERLQGMPWYVQRNLLHLLGRLPNLPDRLELDPFVRHQDARVRHEAVALLIHDPLTSERGIAEGLVSRQEATVRLALVALADRCTPKLAERVLARLGEGTWSAETRALAVSAIASEKSPSVLRMLRRLVMSRSFVGLGRIAPRNPAMLAALRGLAAHWSQERGVSQLLEAARASRDPEIRDAARGLGGRRSGAASRLGV